MRNFVITLAFGIAWFVVTVLLLVAFTAFLICTWEFVKSVIAYL